MFLSTTVHLDPAAVAITQTLIRSLTLTVLTRLTGKLFFGLSLKEVDANRTVKETAVSATEGILSRRTIHQKQHSS